MSIDKESHGFPEVNLQRRTTKVNVSMIAAVLLFFAVALGIGLWVAMRTESPRVPPSAPTESR